MTESVRELLDKVGRCYTTFAEHYEALENDSMQSERVAQIARYLSQWEQARAQSLKSALANPSYKSALATHLKERPSLPEDKDLLDGDFSFAPVLSNETHSEGSIAASVSERHNAIADSYSKLSTIVSCEELRELFTTLAEDEEREVKRAIHSIQEFEFV